MDANQVFNIIRGANGVGSWNLNRRFVHEFGLSPALLLADLARGYTYSLKIHTNVDGYFPWNPTSFMNATYLNENELRQCFVIMDESKLWKVKKIDGVIYVWVNWPFLESINNPVALEEYVYE